MIRINLLATEAQQAPTPVQAAAATPSAQRITMLAALVLAITVAGLGAWYWSLHRQSAAVDADIASAEAEARNLQSVLAQVNKFEARKAQLQQRVTLIEQLRAGQSASVRVLDQVSRSVPESLWLSELTQAGSDFTIAGFAKSMTALSDFAGDLEATRWFRKPVEIIDSEVASDPKTGDLVRFVVKATYVDRDAPPPPPAVVPAVAEKR